jgi:hypothetical protein
MKNILLLTLISFAVITTTSAQWSIGGRFGGASGVSIKHYPASNGLLFEGISAFSFDEELDDYSLTLLLEKFGPLSDDGKLGAILGAGETMVFTDDFLLGVSAILGFDWRIGRRIGVQLDWLPTYIFINDSHFNAVNAAFTARWIFGGRRNQ